MSMLCCFTLQDQRLHVEKVFQTVNLLRPGGLLRTFFQLIVISSKMQGEGWWEKMAKENGGGLGHISSYQNIKTPYL